MKRGSKVRVGVVGTGWWATQFHLPALLANEEAVVTSLVDPNREKLTAVGERFGVERLFTDHRELLASGLVDAVVIATPHSTHYALARDSLDAGVHVLVEKPMVLTSEDAWDLVERAKRAGLHLVVGYTYQFTPHAQRAREVVQSGEIGEIAFVSGLFASMVESYYRGEPEDYRAVFEFPLTGPDAATYSDPALAGGGQGHTQVTHAMGMVLWVTGLRAAEVCAFMDNRGLRVDLVDAISYRLSNGAVGTMGSTGTLRPEQPQQQEIRYYGSDGFLLQELIHGRMSVHRNDGRSEELVDLSPAELYPADAPSRCLVSLVHGDGENLADAESAAATVAFLEAAYESARLERPVAVRNG